MLDNFKYYLSFSHFEGVGPMKFAALVKYFGSPKKAYVATPNDLYKVIGVNLTNKFLIFRNKFDAGNKIKELAEKQIRVVTREDAQYPQQLKDLTDAPICLYVRGNIDKFDFKNERFFAIVGTRKLTAYGEQITEKFSTELTQAGFIIVSGLAMGVDAVAHTACLDVGGRTIAFLGCGVDIIYPPINTKLYWRIINSGGLVISEFPPGRTVMPGLFVARNRLISGLSCGVMVTEGAHDSGAMITARYAAEQGKDVFAPPVPITSEMSEAPSILLKNGAKFVTTTADILEEYNLKLIPSTKKQIIDKLIGEEKLVASLLMSDAFTTDELIEKSKLNVSQILNILSLLELKGIVEKNREGSYQLKIY